MKDARFCSTDGNAADHQLNSNGYATAIRGKDFLAMVFFLPLPS
jgi:hypothetical protein